ncbi:MAG: archaeal flagellar protein FlaJ [Candidatus Diapherotrites archaeon]|nr:archaeal flagellar protein FlaJ [Candidatus Diapherotrites archaeon]
MPLKIRIGKRTYRVSDFAVVFTVSLLFAVAVITYGFYKYADTPYFYTLVFAGVMGFILPVGGYIYYGYVKLQEKEYYFPQFLKDLADGARAGLSLPQAVMNVSKINYGALTDDVRRLATYISWGVPFDEAMRRFAERTGSKMIRSSVDLILEAYTAGGGIADILDTMAEDAGKMRSLKEERKTRFSGFISTMYAVYVIFLLIVMVLVNALLPEIPTMPSFGKSGGTLFVSFGVAGAKPIPEDELMAIFFHLAMIEAVFAGLLAGVAGEGSIAAGIKHALILIFIGVAVFQIFIPIPDPVDRIARAIAKTPANIDATVFVGRYFVDRSITVGMISEAVEDRLKQMNLPIIGSRGSIRFDIDSAGCEPCSSGYIQVLPDAIIVKRPAYVTFRIKTDPDRGAYVIYVS